MASTPTILAAHAWALLALAAAIAVAAVAQYVGVLPGEQRHAGRPPVVGENHGCGPRPSGGRRRSPSTQGHPRPDNPEGIR